MDLLTVSEARRSAVIDDVRELADVIRDGLTNPGLRLAIHSAAGVRSPIADELLRWGIPTLSSVARGPLNPVGRNTTSTGGEYLETVHAISDPRTGRQFRKQLQEFDVPQSLIEPQFQRRLLAIRRVVVAGSLTVQFRVRGRLYRAPRQWAVLPKEVWLDDDGDVDDLLAKAIADIVFIKPRPRYLASVLKDALRHRAREFRPSQAASGYEDEGIDETPGSNETPGSDETTDSTTSHPGVRPDPKRNEPNPGKLFSGSGNDRTANRKPSGRKPVVAEDIQRRELKIDHYASHCQIELARRSPFELAPAGTYVEFAENRIRILEAHHPDKASASGGRHAGNLLILTKVNHDAIGKRLSRADITEALRVRWKPHRILRPDGTIWLEGGIADAIDKLTGDVIPFFFTNWHRDYWLTMASPSTQT